MFTRRTVASINGAFTCCVLTERNKLTAAKYLELPWYAFVCCTFANYRNRICSPRTGKKGNHSPPNIILRLDSATADATECLNYATTRTLEQHNTAAAARSVRERKSRLAAKNCMKLNWTTEDDPIQGERNKRSRNWIMHRLTDFQATFSTNFTKSYQDTSLPRCSNLKITVHNSGAFTELLSPYCIKLLRLFVRLYTSNTSKLGKWISINFLIGKL
jgi:hypothetical protein